MGQGNCSILNFFAQLKNVFSRRHFFQALTSFHYKNTYEFHGCSDVSGKAYGFRVYLKCVTKSNFISMSSVASNSEVTPYKEKLMRPRSELLSNFLFFSNRFNCISKRNVSNIYAWTDSKVYLAWIKKLKNFKLLFKIEQL